MSNAGKALGVAGLAFLLGFSVFLLAIGIVYIVVSIIPPSGLPVSGEETQLRAFLETTFGGFLFVLSVLGIEYLLRD